MRIKKIILTMVMFVAILLPANAFASEIEPYTAGWQLVGTETFNITAGKDILTKTYTATDGANFKLDITGNGVRNSVAASMYINGVYYGDTKGAAYSDGNASLEFSGLKPGDRVQFLFSALYSDYITIKFYD
jgi:hypothetical protein